MAAVILFSITLALSVSPSNEGFNLFNFGGIVLSPIQDAASNVKDSIANIGSYFGDRKKLNDEIDEARRQIRFYERQIAGLEGLVIENENLKQTLGFKEENPELELVYANIVARDPSNFFNILTINKGTIDGIKLHDTVITKDGLVGLISEVSLNFSKVTVVTDPSAVIGVKVSRTHEVCVLEGDMENKLSGMCKLTLLPPNPEAKVGDIVKTSGYGGIFVGDITVGKIVSVSQEEHTISSYALLEPMVDIKKITAVMVIIGNEIEANNV